MFAPYVDVMLFPTYSIANAAKVTGAIYYTLAFIIADTAGEPRWGGLIEMKDNFYAQEIAQIRAIGGDVIISFGGALGTELAVSSQNSNLDLLVSRYERVIKQYNVNMIDLDIEGASLDNKASVELRNLALAKLQTNMPNLKVSYTLPVLPSGLGPSALTLLRHALLVNVRIDVVNIMTMDFGVSQAPDGVTKMSEYVLSAAKATQAQLLGIFVEKNYGLGITVMIGQNDVKTEIFTQSDANILVKFAKETSYISRLSMWSMNRDVNNVNGELYASSKIIQSDLEFTRLLSTI
jgi:chitinase